MREIGDQANALNEQTKELSEKLSGLMLTLPNLPMADVPVGEDESGSVIVRQNGEPLVLEFSPSRTGTWAKNWASSTLSGAPSWPAADSTP